MLDESEFKPFSLTDFTAVESDPSENDDTSDGRGKNAEGSENRKEYQIEDRLTSFKPLTFTVEGDSDGLVTEVRTDAESEKTDAEKIKL